MKNLLFFLLMPLIGSAQVKLYNASLTDTSLNYVYLGAQNELVAVGVDNAKNLRLEVRQGTVTPDKYRSNFFSFYTEKNDFPSDTFKLYDGDRLLLEKILVYKYVGVPTFKIAHSMDTVLRMEDLVTEPVLEFYPNHQYKSPYHHILQFRMEIFRKQACDTLDFYTVEGNRFTEAQTNMIMGLRTGDKIRISNVMAHCDGCRMKLRMRPRTIRIK